MRVVPLSEAEGLVLCRLMALAGPSAGIQTVLHAFMHAFSDVTDDGAAQLLSVSSVRRLISLPMRLAAALLARPPAQRGAGADAPAAALPAALKALLQGGAAAPGAGPASPAVAVVPQLPSGALRPNPSGAAASSAPSAAPAPFLAPLSLAAVEHLLVAAAPPLDGLLHPPLGAGDEAPEDEASQRRHDDALLQARFPRSQVASGVPCAAQRGALRRGGRQCCVARMTRACAGGAVCGAHAQVARVER